MNDSHDPRGLGAALREEARRLRSAPAPEGLRGRVLDAVRVEAPSTAERPRARRSLRRVLPAVGALAAGLALVFVLSRPAPEPGPEPEAAARLSLRVGDLIDDVSAPLLALAPERSPLEGEAERLWQDTNRMARGVLGDLPGPLRSRLLGDGERRGD